MRVRRTLVAFVVCILFTTVLAGKIRFVGESLAAPTDWVEEHLKDTAVTIASVAIGDADNDGYNEVVMGLFSGTNELRSYEKEGGIWKESIIADLPDSVQSVAIGNADSDMANEVVIGMWTTTNEVRAYEYVDGAWVEEIIVDLPVNVNSVAIGNPDDDLTPEVVVGMGTTANEIRAYEKVGVVWTEEIVADTPDFVSSVVVGDADNDGDEEIIAGLGGNMPPMTFITNELRMYEKVLGSWVETPVADTQVDVLSVAIGDSTNNGTNEIVISTGWAFGGTPWEVRSYFNVSGTWAAEGIADPPTQELGEVRIGDADNDGLNEVIGNFAPWIMATGYVNSYKKSGGTWSEEIIATALPQQPATAAVGDADNDGKNEIVVGLVSSIRELRMYSRERGNILFTSHGDGEYVSGTINLEVAVTSDHIYAVKFYLNDSPMFTDTTPPYQFVLNTSILTEDAMYEVKAEGLRMNALPLNATIDIVVNNVVQVGDYITTSTLKNEYEPDEELSVIVGTKSPPLYDQANLMVSYSDPLGNTLYSEGRMVPPNTLYILYAPVFSDALLGTYSLRVDAYGFMSNSYVWYATNSTTFNVTGKSLHERIADLDLNLSVGNLTDLIAGLNASLTSKITAMETNILNAIAGVNTSLSSEIQNLLVTITNEILGLNASLSSQLTNLLNNMTNDINALRTWLATVLGAIDANLTATNNTLHAQLTNLETTMTNFYNTLRTDISDIMTALQAHDMATGENHTDIKNMIDALVGNITVQVNFTELKNMLTNLSIDLASHDTALSNNILLVVNNIDSFETDVDQMLQEINTTLVDLYKLDDIITDLNALDIYLQQAIDALSTSVGETSDAEVAKIDGQTMLLLLILVLLIITIILNVVAMLRMRGGKPESEIEEEMKEDEEELDLDL